MELAAVIQVMESYTAHICGEVVVIDLPAVDKCACSFEI